jgi:hypothetical protein
MTNFKAGDLVRFKKSGREFTLDDVNPNEAYREEDEYYASGWSEYGTEDVGSPEEIELVMRADEAAARTLPTADEIVQALDLLGAGFGDVIDVDETDHEGDGVLLAYGKADNGLRVAFKVTVSEVERTDF